MSARRRGGLALLLAAALTIPARPGAAMATGDPGDSVRLAALLSAIATDLRLPGRPCVATEPIKRLIGHSEATGVEQLIAGRADAADLRGGRWSDARAKAVLRSLRHSERPRRVRMVRSIGEETCASVLAISAPFVAGRVWAVDEWLTYRVAPPGCASERRTYLAEEDGAAMRIAARYGGGIVVC